MTAPSEVVSRICTECGVEKPFSEFYENKKGKHGLYSQCKECMKIKGQKYYVKNSAEILRKGKIYREEHSEIARAASANWKKANVERVKKYHRDYQVAQGVETRARNKFSNAMKLGKISKPDSCSFCGTPTESRALDGHHPDYSKPLDVIWLCRKCHSIVHRRINVV